MKLNDAIQWAGTACFMVMYTFMSLNMYPWNILAGFFGGALYMVWSMRVAVSYTHLTLPTILRV